MSWWISLNDPVTGETLMVRPFRGGGTYILYEEVPELVEADLNVTWNYSKWYYLYLNSDEGFRWLDGKRAIDTLATLISAYEWLGDETGDDYWKASPGNAGAVLVTLIDWVDQHPNGIWRVN